MQYEGQADSQDKALQCSLLVFRSVAIGAANVDVDLIPHVWLITHHVKHLQS